MIQKRNRICKLLPGIYTEQFPQSVAGKCNYLLHYNCPFMHMHLSFQLKKDPQQKKQRFQNENAVCYKINSNLR